MGLRYGKNQVVEGTGLKTGQIGTPKGYLDAVMKIAKQTVDAAVKAHAARGSARGESVRDYIRDAMTEPQITRDAARVILALSPHAFDAEPAKFAAEGVGHDYEDLATQIGYEVFFMDLWDAASEYMEKRHDIRPKAGERPR